jgi:hypothetical protein
VAKPRLGAGFAYALADGSADHVVSDARHDVLLYENKKHSISGLKDSLFRVQLWISSNSQASVPTPVEAPLRNNPLSCIKQAI